MISAIDSVGVFKSYNRSPFKGNSSWVFIPSMMRQGYDSVHFGNAAKKDEAEVCKRACGVEIFAKSFVENLGINTRIYDILEDVSDKGAKDKEFLRDFVTYMYKKPGEEGNGSSLLEKALDRDALIAARGFFDLVKNSDEDIQKSFLKASHKYAEKDYKFRSPYTREVALDFMEFAADKVPEEFMTWELSEGVKNSARFVEIANILADKGDIDKKVRKKYILDNKDYIRSAPEIIAKIETESSRKPEKVAEKVTENLPVIVPEPQSESVEKDTPVGLHDYLDDVSKKDLL
jgi:hypothetical protein